MRADVEEDLIAREHAGPAIVQAHLKRFRRHKTSVPMISSAPLDLYCGKVAATSPSTMSRLRWRTLVMSTRRSPSSTPKLAP